MNMVVSSNWDPRRRWVHFHPRWSANSQQQCLLGFSISGFGGICCRLCSALISRLQSWGWRRGNGTGTFFAGLICFQDMEFGHCLGRFFFWTCEAATNNKLGLISVDLVIRGDSFGGMSSLTGAGTRGQAPEERREQWESDGVQVSAAWPKERFGLLNAFEKMIRSFFF